MVAVSEWNWSLLGMTLLFVLSESLSVLRSKQSGKRWEGSTCTYAWGAYSVKHTVMLEYTEFSRQCFVPTSPRSVVGRTLVSTIFVLTSSVMDKIYFSIPMPRNYHIMWKIGARGRFFLSSRLHSQEYGNSLCPLPLWSLKFIFPQGKEVRCPLECMQGIL